MAVPRTPATPARIPRAADLRPYLPGRLARRRRSRSSSPHSASASRSRCSSPSAARRSTARRRCSSRPSSPATTRTAALERPAPPRRRTGSPRASATTISPSQRQAFSADVPGLGNGALRQPDRDRAATVAATSRAPSRRSSIVAHRDNLGGSPGADYNASGTGALLELGARHRAARRSHTRSSSSPRTEASSARSARPSSPRLGPRRPARGGHRPGRDRRARNPRLHFGGDTPRSPASTLVATAEASVEAQSQRRRSVPNALSPADRPRVPVQPLRAGPVRRAGAPRLHAEHRRAPARRRAEGDTLVALDQERLASSGDPRRRSSARSTRRPTSRAGRSPTSTSARGSSAAGRSSSSSSAASCRSSPRPSTSSHAAGGGASRSGPRCGAWRVALGLWLWVGRRSSRSSPSRGSSRTARPGRSRPSSALRQLARVARSACSPGSPLLGWLVARPRLVPPRAGRPDRRARRAPRRHARARRRRARRRGAEPLRAHLRPPVSACLALAAACLGARAARRRSPSTRSGSSGRSSSWLVRASARARLRRDLVPARAHLGRVTCPSLVLAVPRLGRGRGQWARSRSAATRRIRRRTSAPARGPLREAIRQAGPLQPAQRARSGPARKTPRLRSVD